MEESNIVATDNTTVDIASTVDITSTGSARTGDVTSTESTTTGDVTSTMTVDVASTNDDDDDDDLTPTNIVDSTIIDGTTITTAEANKNTRIFFSHFREGETICIMEKLAYKNRIGNVLKLKFESCKETPTDHEYEYRDKLEQYLPYNPKSITSIIKCHFKFKSSTFNNHIIYVTQECGIMFLRENFPQFNWIPYMYASSFDRVLFDLRQWAPKGKRVDINENSIRHNIEIKCLMTKIHFVFVHHIGFMPSEKESVWNEMFKMTQVWKDIQNLGKH